MDAEILQIIARDGDVVVGTLEDDLHIRVDFPSGPDGYEEFVSTVSPGAEIFVGAFPDRGNDGIRAVTVTLPDGDGIVRPHPH